MTPTRSIAVCVVAFLAFVTAGVALAQAPQTPPTRLRGSIAAIDDKSVTVATREGTTAKVNLADNWGVLLVVPVTMADIKENSFVGVASLKGADGTLNALEVLVFPENMRGVGEGHYAWDLKPESKMTNGNVADVKSVGKDHMLTVQYKGGEQKVLVPGNAKVVMFGPGERSELKKGSHIFVVAQRQPDGSLSAARVNVGMKGTVPPM